MFRVQEPSKEWRQKEKVARLPVPIRPVHTTASDQTPPNTSLSWTRGARIREPL